MDLIYIGKLVNTHGIKGEVRIISNFKYKKDAFKTGNTLIINNDKLVINTYRTHKNYDMITFQGINDINDILKYKGSNVYISREELNINGILEQDLIGLEVYDKDKYMGKVVDIYKTKKDDLLVIDGIKKHMIPNIPAFIKNIDIDNNKIEIKYIKGFVDED